MKPLDKTLTGPHNLIQCISIKIEIYPDKFGQCHIVATMKRAQNTNVVETQHSHGRRVKKPMYINRLRVGISFTIVRFFY